MKKSIEKIYPNRRYFFSTLSDFLQIQRSTLRDSGIACVGFNEKQSTVIAGPITPPGFVEVARSRNLELIRRRYIIHDTTGRAGWLTGFLHNACVDLFSEVSGRQPSGRLFFARTSCPDTRETRLSSPSLLPSHFISKIISSTNRYTVQGERKREKSGTLETQIFDGDLPTVNLSIFRDPCFDFGTQTRRVERCVGETRVVAAAAAAAYCVSPSV